MGAAIGHGTRSHTIDLGVGGAIVSHGQVLTGVAERRASSDTFRSNRRGHVPMRQSRLPRGLRKFRRPLELARERYGPITIEEVARRARRRRRVPAAHRGHRRGGRPWTWYHHCHDQSGTDCGCREARPLGRHSYGCAGKSYDRHSLVKSYDVGEGARTRMVPSRFVGTGACMGAVGLVLRHHGRLH